MSSNRKCVDAATADDVESRQAEYARWFWVHLPAYLSTHFVAQCRVVSILPPFCAVYVVLVLIQHQMLISSVVISIVQGSGVGLWFMAHIRIFSKMV
jgi:hypothetical protein